MESTVCEGCRRVNPGGLRESNGKVLCWTCRQEDMITRNLLNENQYDKLVRTLTEQGINRPKTREIMIILDLDSPLQAQRYGNLYHARHPQHYQVPTTGGAIQHAIKGEPIQGRTPELTKAMKDAEKGV